MADAEPASMSADRDRPVVKVKDCGRELTLFPAGRHDDQIRAGGAGGPFPVPPVRDPALTPDAAPMATSSGAGG